MRRKILLPLMAAMVVSPVLANDAIKQRMAEVVPSLTPDSIEATGIEGLYEVRYSTDIFYISADGRYLLQGSLIDLETRENLTEAARREVRAEIFASIPDSELTVFEPSGTVRHTINVFTDPNCTFCRQLHQEMATYLKAGVKVRYFMFPVLGRDSPTVMNNIWCAESRTDAMDLAKAGRAVPTASCPTPAEEHLSLGRGLGVSGTPATITDGGQLISGYRPAIEVIQALSGR
jgi:thiol:disulfide interchange protein DsbC